MRVLAFAVILALSLAYASLAEQSACDYGVAILIDGEEFENELLKWRIKATKINGNSANITGNVYIEDMNGKIIKKYRTWTHEQISKQKTSSEYSPNLKEDFYKINAEINVSCEDTNKSNNEDVKEIKVKNEKRKIIATEELTTNISFKNTISLAKTSQKNQIQHNAANDLYTQSVYKSSGEKSKELIVILLLALSILLNIILIWKR